MRKCRITQLLCLCLHWTIFSFFDCLGYMAAKTSHRFNRVLPTIYLLVQGVPLLLVRRLRLDGGCEYSTTDSEIVGVLWLDCRADSFDSLSTNGCASTSCKRAVLTTTLTNCEVLTSIVSSWAFNLVFIPEICHNNSHIISLECSSVPSVFFRTQLPEMQSTI